MESIYTQAMWAAVEAAKKFEGATSPNPPVGAAGLDENGAILEVAAHERAGTAHAEVKVIEALRARGELHKLKTLVVTLEPCNHQGRTGPCTHALLHTAIERVVLGARDPNPNVVGGGIDFLRSHGIEVVEGVLTTECEALIRSFRHKMLTGKPWITVKRALRKDGSMLPPLGAKTFTSATALRFAHGLRKRADAIVTGSGTVLADDPKFTVRLVEDNRQKERFLFVADRRGRVPSVWKSQAHARGFQVIEEQELDKAFDFFQQPEVMEVLVEAGPELSAYILQNNLWNELVEIVEGEPGEIRTVRNSSYAVGNA